MVSAALLLSTLGGCESCLERIKKRPTRRRLRTGSPEVDAAIATYKEAVTLMKALPASNPRSWSAQAALHGTVSPNVFNFCQHGTNHFFSWHRAYLLYFEQICRTHG
jgi:tyrosinase